MPDVFSFVLYACKIPETSFLRTGKKDNGHTHTQGRTRCPGCKSKLNKKMITRTVGLLKEAASAAAGDASAGHLMMPNQNENYSKMP